MMRGNGSGLSELSNLYDQIRDLKEKANKLYSQAQMNYKSAKDEEAQGRLTGNRNKEV